MKRMLPIFLLLAGFRSSAQAQVDLTPSVREYSSQGCVYQQVRLRQAKQDIIFVLPQGWNVRGGADRLHLEPPNKEFADAIITANALPGPKPIDEATAKALQQQVVSEVPPGSHKVEIVRREENPVPMGANPSLELVISYTTIGHIFQRSVIFVHTSDTQFVFRFTSRKEDFGALSSVFRQSIASWQWVDNRAPSDESKMASK